MTRSRNELEELSECFSRLETDIESFSAALSRLSDARKGITRHRRARGPLPDLQHKKRMGDAITTLDALPRGGLGLLVLGRAEELLAGSSLGSLRFFAIVAGTATVFCLWGMRQKVGYGCTWHIDFYQTEAGTKQKQRNQRPADNSSARAKRDSYIQPNDCNSSWCLLRRFVWGG